MLIIPLARVNRIALLLLIIPLFLIRCKDDLPALTGTNETFITGGRADDGDDQTTPPAFGVRYINPARTASDGPAKAVSDPQNFKSLRGGVIAQPGSQPVRMSTVTSFNTVTSTFVVRRAARLKFEITSSASATLNSGSAGYLVAARVKDNAGQNVAASNFQARFDFTENANGKNDVAQNNVQFTQVADGDPIQSTDRIRTAFTLQPGTYTLEFDLKIEAEADTKAELTVSSSVELIGP
jgi:hypothetical protein